MATYKRHTVWVDQQHKTRLAVLTGNASLATLVGTLLNHSTGGVSYNVESVQPVSPTAEPSVGGYSTVQDIARLVFKDSTTADIASVTLPLPTTDIFLADQFTVDATKITDIITAALGVVLTSSGNVVDTFVAGFRESGPTREY